MPAKTPEENRRKVREWALKNPEKAKAAALRTYANNTDRAIANASRWARENRDRRREINRESERRRRAANPDEFKAAKLARRLCPANRLNDSISSYMRMCLKGRKAGAAWEALVGYSLEDLIFHLSSLFSDGMTLENYGEWHIDHCRPIASFNFSSADDDEFKQCWALSNLQPLWAVENIRKNSRWNGEMIRRPPGQAARV